MRVAFFTLGCKVNQYETEAMREGFIKMGYTAVSEDSPFDVIVINSCTVTAESDRKTRQVLNRFRRENPDAVIVLTGCMVQAFSEDSAKLSGADIVVGNRDIKRVLELTEEFLSQRERKVEVISHSQNDLFNTPNISDFAERTRAYMKIEDGCDRYCTYCIIPTARGFVRSKPLEDIRREAQALAEKGFVEIVLVGINLSAYGKGGETNLCDAVETVCSVEGIKRVRLGSLEPDHISDQMLLRFKAQEKFCPQFHLSLQSGCDKTLKRMNRHYDTAFYTDLVTRIRAMFPEASLTTDIMVGFAGETQEDFTESVEYLEKTGFAKSHVFAYSRRKGTFAYNMPNQVTKAEKSRRSKIMCEAANRSETAFLTKQMGKTVDVLFETEENGCCWGYTPNYSRVFVRSDIPLSGKIKKVKLISVQGDCCEGELAE